jgi:hypothetical protein
LTSANTLLDSSAAIGKLARTIRNHLASQKYCAHLHPELVHLRSAWPANAPAHNPAITPQACLLANPTPVSARTFIQSLCICAAAPASGC